MQKTLAILTLSLIPALSWGHAAPQCEIDFQPVTPEPDTGQRIYEASTLAEARSGFLTRYGTRARDCDPVGGKWQCSNEQIGGNMPDGSSQPAVQPAPEPIPEIPSEPTSACSAVTTAAGIKECIKDKSVIGLASDITYFGCPTVFSFQQKFNITVNGNGHTIKRTNGQRSCNLVDIDGSSNISFNDITLDDDARDATCVVADKCPTTVDVKNSESISFDNTTVQNGKGYAIYTADVDGFRYTNGALYNSGVLGMYIGHGDEPTSDVFISNNVFHKNSANALAVLGGNDVVITNNTFTNNHHIGQWPVAPQFGTGITGGGQLYIARGANILVMGNTIKDGICTTCRGGISGIEISTPNSSTAVSNLTLDGNTVINNTGTGITTNQGATVRNLVVINNAVSGNVKGNGIPNDATPTPAPAPITNRPTPSNGWADSYEVGGVCYILPSSTLDHGIGGVLVATPSGQKTVAQIKRDQRPPSGSSGRPLYNDVQCGNGPPNNAGDEDQDKCPGRVDQGQAGCSVIGPKWDLG